MMDPIPYSPDVEIPLQDEDRVIGELREMMVDLGRTVAKKRGHAFHGTHAKLIGLFAGSVRVLDNLPYELAQGMFAEPAEYDTLVRFAPGPPEPLTDQASGQRGMSMKVMGIEGQRIESGTEAASQDWVFGLDPTFSTSTASSFQRIFSITGAKSPYMPEAAVLALSRVGRVAEAALEMVGTESGNLKFFARPPRHPMAETYYSQAAVRYGAFVAKLAIVPSAETLTAIGDPSAIGSHRDAFSHAIKRVASNATATYEIRVQLRTDAETMPVEDAAAEWPQDKSPYITVAILTLPPQDPLTADRRSFDDRIAFSPANGLADHQPLGSVMRARMAAYADVQAFRRASNGVAAFEPRSNADIPD